MQNRGGNLSEIGGEPEPEIGGKSCTQFRFQIWGIEATDWVKLTLSFLHSVSGYNTQCSAFFSFFSSLHSVSIQGHFM